MCEGEIAKPDRLLFDDVPGKLEALWFNHALPQNLSAELYRDGERIAAGQLNPTYGVDLPNGAGRDRARSTARSQLQPSRQGPQHLAHLLVFLPNDEQHLPNDEQHLRAATYASFACGRGFSHDSSLLTSHPHGTPRAY